MKIENEFTVDASIQDAWALLTDIPAIAPCLPGAKLTDSDGDVHEGTVTVRVGPMTAKYNGTVEFASRDDDAHRAQLKASGRDARGAGTAEAMITAQLSEVDGGTRVEIETDLVISGKVAQFGKGVMVDVSEQMLGQFADCIGAKLDEEEGAEEVDEGEETGPTDGAVAAPGTRRAPRTPAADDEPEPLDLLQVAGGAVGRRAAIGVAMVAAVVLVVWLLRRSIAG